MDSVEQSIKRQFAKIFATKDASLFKMMADANLQEAAHLRKDNLPVPASLKLLARNSRKRLLIGIGVELLLKAYYLNAGYYINTIKKNGTHKFPVKFVDADEFEFNEDKTIKLSDLVQHLPSPLKNDDMTMRGLQIAKVFRNKEGHSVTRTHVFDPNDYTDIASALVRVYKYLFGQNLRVHFSVEPNEESIWILKNAP